MAKILIQLKMVKVIYICEIYKFAYKSKSQAKKCEEWCNNHKSCSLEITKNSIGVINYNNYNEQK